MYESFFGLNEKPFNMTPDPEYLFFTDQHREAFAHLVYGIRERRGFIAVTGEVGAGKTTLCRAMLNEFDESTRIALILNPMLSDVELLRAICDELFIETKGESKKELLDALNAHLIEEHSAGKNVVLIIDEAQNLCDQTLEQIRIISNLETVKAKLIQIVLVGQPELGEKLAKKELRQLNQRITVRYHLTSLSPKESENYIAHRLRVAGSQGKIKFTKGALKEIHRFSQGVPRKINVICDHALLSAFVRETCDIDRNIIRKAWEEIEGPSPRGRKRAIPAWVMPTGRVVATALLLAAAAIVVAQNKSWLFSRFEAKPTVRFASADPSASIDQSEEDQADVPAAVTDSASEGDQATEGEVAENEATTPETEDESGETAATDESSTTESEEVAEDEAVAATDESSATESEEAAEDETVSSETEDESESVAATDESSATESDDESTVSTPPEGSVEPEVAEETSASETESQDAPPETGESVEVAMVAPPDEEAEETVPPPPVTIEAEATESETEEESEPVATIDPPPAAADEGSSPEETTEAKTPPAEESVESLWSVMTKEPSGDEDVSSEATKDNELRGVALEVSELPSPGPVSNETYGDGEFDAQGVLHTSQADRNTVASLLTLAFRWHPEEYPVYQAYRSVVEENSTVEKALQGMGLEIQELDVSLDRVCVLDLPAAVEIKEPQAQAAVTAVVLEASPNALVVSVPSDGRKAYSRDELDSVWNGRAYVCVPFGETEQQIIGPTVEGPAVLVLESRLSQLGFLDQVPSDTFDEDTEAALKAFQEKYRLEATGVADPETQILLFALTSESGVPCLNSQVASGNP
jgi:type II secretory pathway predicted ATPase ExeA